MMSVLTGLPKDLNRTNARLKGGNQQPFFNGKAFVNGSLNLRWPQIVDLPRELQPEQLIKNEDFLNGFVAALYEFAESNTDQFRSKFAEFGLSNSMTELIIARAKTSRLEDTERFLEEHDRAISAFTFAAICMEIGARIGTIIGAIIGGISTGGPGAIPGAAVGETIGGTVGLIGGGVAGYFIFFPESSTSSSGDSGAAEAADRDPNSAPWVPRKDDWHDAGNINPPHTDPLMFDLDRDGKVDVSRKVFFDLDGNGFAEYTSWAGGRDGVLVMDRNGDGVINDGSELYVCN